MRSSKMTWSAHDADAARWWVILDGERVTAPVRAEVVTGLCWCYLALATEPHRLAYYANPGRASEQMLVKCSGHIGFRLKSAG